MKTKEITKMAKDQKMVKVEGNNPVAVGGNNGVANRVNHKAVRD